LEVLNRHATIMMEVADLICKSCKKNCYCKLDTIVDHEDIIDILIKITFKNFKIMSNVIKSA